MTRSTIHLTHDWSALKYQDENSCSHLYIKSSWHALGSKIYPRSEYPLNATLVEGEYYLYWNFSKAADSIQFGVRVKTTGWIGFGLSPSGQMVGSDVIGWINNEGTVYYHVSGMHVENTKWNLHCMWTSL